MLIKWVASSRRSSGSVCPRSFAPEIPVVANTENKITLQTATGEPIKLYGVKSVPFSFGHYKIFLPMAIFGLFPDTLQWQNPLKNHIILIQLPRKICTKSVNAKFGTMGHTKIRIFPRPRIFPDFFFVLLLDILSRNKNKSQINMAIKTRYKTISF